MQPDLNFQYRRMFQNSECFSDISVRVDTPWDSRPDVPEFNQDAYEDIAQQLEMLRRDKKPSSRGLLILGEAGSGKTHLLMRVAQNLSTVSDEQKEPKSHLLHVCCPTNEDAVVQHIWNNIVVSLGHCVSPDSSQSQLNNMLAHVFSAVLIPEFEEDIANGKDVKQKQGWKKKLEANPYNLFAMLGSGPTRRKNMEYIRKKTLEHLRTKPEADQQIAHLLISYCLIDNVHQKRAIIDWLRGQELSAEDAKRYGLNRPTWIELDETTTHASVQQAREDFAYKAIQTIGALSTYYRPLILAFDQLEGLRGHERLTHMWGNAVKEIFTRTPNLLVLTCIFPNLWKEWFLSHLGADPETCKSVADRIIGNRNEPIILDNFSSEYAKLFVEAYIEQWRNEFELPDSGYPFTDEDIEVAALPATTARIFIQNINSMLMKWVWSKEKSPPPPPPLPPPGMPTPEEINDFIGKRLAEYRKKHQDAWGQNTPIESDYFGRIDKIIERIAALSTGITKIGEATFGGRVMPENRLYREPKVATATICVLNAASNAFASRLKNLTEALQEKRQFSHAVIFRHKNCPGLGKACQEHIATFQAIPGGSFHIIDQKEDAFINAVYELLVNINERDFTLRSHEVTDAEFFGCLYRTNAFSPFPFFQTLFSVLPGLGKKRT